jgi:hypothetical protein
LEGPEFGGVHGLGLRRLVAVVLVLELVGLFVPSILIGRFEVAVVLHEVLGRGLAVGFLHVSDDFLGLGGCVGISVGGSFGDYLGLSNDLFLGDVFSRLSRLGCFRRSSRRLSH